VRVWDPETGKEVRKLEGHTNDVNSANFSPDGKRIVSASDDKTVRVWDPETGEQLQQMGLTSDDIVQKVADKVGRSIMDIKEEINFDENRLGEGYKHDELWKAIGNVRGWDPETGRQVHIYEGDEANSHRSEADAILSRVSDLSAEGDNSRLRMYQHVPVSWSDVSASIKPLSYVSDRFQLCPFLRLRCHMRG
jgi:WD40 repeat protein